MKSALLIIDEEKNALIDKISEVSGMISKERAVRDSLVGRGVNTDAQERLIERLTDEVRKLLSSLVTLNKVRERIERETV